MGNIKKTAAMSAMILALAAGAASAKTFDGSNAGEVINGTNNPDTVYAYGGADLVRGYGGADTVWGGNEAGFGDALYGGASGDRLVGQQGDDALYGQGGNDRLEGQYGDDLIVGSSGSDTIDAGPGADEVDARDGQKDTIVIRKGEGDIVYYDRGLDEFLVSSTSGANAMSAQEAMEAGKVKLLAERPPKGLFEPTGKVVVEHEGARLLVAEKGLKGHLAHGDEIIDPTGRAATE